MKKKFFYNAIPCVGPGPVNWFEIETVVIHRGLHNPWVPSLHPNPNSVNVNRFIAGSPWVGVVSTYARHHSP
jgi:hypothetical protein